MILQDVVRAQVLFHGKTPGGCQLTLNYLLNQGHDVFQFMRLFTARDVNRFFLKYEEEINALCDEDAELLTTACPGEWVKVALEKCLMLIEQEIIISCEG